MFHLHKNIIIFALRAATCLALITGVSLTSMQSALAINATKVTKKKSKKSTNTSKASSNHTGTLWTPDQLTMSRADAMQRIGELETKKDENGKFGLVLKSSHKWVTPPIFSFIGSEVFDKDLGVVKTMELSQGNGRGQVLLNPRGMKFFPTMAKYIWINTRNNLIFVQDLYNAPIKRYYMDYGGKVISPYFTETGIYGDLIYGKQAGWDYRLYDTGFDLLSNKSFTNLSVGRLYSGTATEHCYYIHTHNEKKGIINAMGEEVIKPKYASLDMQGAVDALSGDEQFKRDNINFSYLSWFLIAEDAKSGRFGLIDVTGSTVLPFKYSNANEVGAQMKAQYAKKIRPILTKDKSKMEEKLNSKIWDAYHTVQRRNYRHNMQRPSEFSDRQLTMPLPIIQKSAGAVKLMSGNIQIGPDYESIEPHGYSYLAKTKKGKFVLLNIFGERCNSNEFDRIELWNKGKATKNTFIASQGKNWCVLNENGTSLYDKWLTEKELYKNEIAKGVIKAKAKLASLERQEAREARAAAEKARKEKAAAQARARKEKAAAAERARKEKAAARSRQTASTHSSTTHQSPSSSSRSSGSSSGAGNPIVNTWRENSGGGFVIVSQFRNGVTARERWSPCPNCRGTSVCSLCYGSGRCNVCNGQGGIISAGYGNFYPCSLCQGTGVCHSCKGTGKCYCTNYGHPGYVNRGITYMDPSGNIISKDRVNYYTGDPRKENNSSNTASSQRKNAGSSTSNGKVVETVTGYHNNGSEFYTVDIISYNNGTYKARPRGRDSVYNIVRSNDNRYKWCYWNGVTWVYFNSSINL